MQRSAFLRRSKTRATGPRALRGARPAALPRATALEDSRHKASRPRGARRPRAPGAWHGRAEARIAPRAPGSLAAPSLVPPSSAAALGSPRTRATALADSRLVASCRPPRRRHSATARARRRVFPARAPRLAQGRVALGAAPDAQASHQR